MGERTRFAVIRPGALGDAVLTLPVLESLAAAEPDADTLAIGHGVFRLAVQCGLATEWLPFDDARLLGLFAAEGKCPALSGFDLCIAFVGQRDAGLAGALRRSGVRRAVLWPSRPAPGAHVVDHLLGAVREAGMPVVSETPRLVAQEGWLARGRERLRAIGVRGDFLAIHPGSGGRSKCWPLERFIAVGKRLSLPVLWALGPPELERGGFREECARVGHVVANPGLEELAGLLALARGYLGNDSGVSHLAAALGTPTVAVFGPTDPAVWGPRGERVAAVGGPGERGFAGASVERVAAALTGIMSHR